MFPLSRAFRVSVVPRIKTWLKNLPKSLSKFLKNDKVGFFGVMGLALLLIIFKGPSSSEGQASLFKKPFVSYIEETAASVINDLPDHQLADINSVFAYSTSSNKIPKSSILSTIQDNSLVSRGTILTDILDQFSDNSNTITTYEVQEGDTLSFIASDYGVKVNTIITSNNLRNSDNISPGTKLKIPAVDGIVYKIKKGDTVAGLANKYGVDEDKIINFNSLPREGDLQVDTEIVIPGAKLAATPNTNSTGKAIGNIFKGIGKRFAYLPDLGNFFAWPTFGFDWGIVHGRNGVDIANSCGTPIYAAADGAVAIADPSGWNGGFGKYIKITHANGTETLYAHLTKTLISAGDFVSKNEQIGVMGSTGRSTGCHLHFEVHGARNPLAKY